MANTNHQQEEQHQPLQEGQGGRGFPPCQTQLSQKEFTIHHPLIDLLDPKTTYIAGGCCRDQILSSSKIHDFDLVVFKSSLQSAIDSILKNFEQAYPLAKKILVTELKQDSIKCRRQIIMKLNIKHLGCQVDITSLSPDDKGVADELMGEEVVKGGGGGGEQVVGGGEDEVSAGGSGGGGGCGGGGGNSISSALQADALLRDFTINSLYYDLESEVVLDPLGRGLKDLADGKLKLVSDQTLKDDPIRILRAARFLSLFPFLEISKDDLNLYHDREVIRELCEKSSEDRFRSEICRLLKLPSDRGLHFLTNLDWSILAHAIDLLTASNSKDWTRRARLELFKDEYHLTKSAEECPNDRVCSDAAN